MDIEDFFADIDVEKLYGVLGPVVEGFIADLEEKGYSGDSLSQALCVPVSLAVSQRMIAQYHEWLVSQLADGTFLPQR